MTEHFKGKVAIVTGSSAGIGAATAILLAEHGCHVTITGRNADKLMAVENKCKQFGVKVVKKIGEIDNEDYLKDLVKCTETELGPIDILVNNAGGMKGAQNCTENFDYCMRVNVRSPYILANLCLESLKKTQGCIINISSVAAVTPSPNMMDYGISKAALDYFTKALAKQLAPFKFDRMALYHPIGRVSVPDEIANMIMYLAGPHAGFITGSIMLIDGGVALGPPPLPPGTSDSAVEALQKTIQEQKIEK